MKGTVGLHGYKKLTGKFWFAKHIICTLLLFQEPIRIFLKMK